LHISQVVHQAGAYAGFCSIKGPGMSHEVDRATYSLFIGEEISFVFIRSRLRVEKNNKTCRRFPFLISLLSLHRIFM